MSTRCNIICKIKREGEEPKQFAVLYHHCDGHPEGVGEDLKERLESASDIKRRHVGSFINSIVKDTMDDYEITTDLHWDVEYVYTILFEPEKATLSYHEVEDFGHPESGEEIIIKVFE